MAGSDNNARELSRRETKLFAAKGPLDSLNQELALNFYPERADFTVERSRGSEFALDVFDSEPMRCRRDLGNARASMLRPRGQQWFKVRLPDPKLNEKPEVARRLDWINARARSLIYQARAGFVRAAKQADQDVVTFGGGVISAEAAELRDGGKRLKVSNWHLRDCAWLDDADGSGQDFLARRFKASARHIKQKFPDAPLHDNIKNALEKEPDTEFKLCHVMMLADEYTYQQKPARNARYVSVYYDSDHEMLLRERPSDRFRYVVEKWGELTGSQYPYSPAAMTALPDARGIQTMALVLLEAGEKSLDPPLRATREAIKSDIDQGAGGITWVDGQYDEKTGPAISRLFPTDPNPPIGIDLIERTTQALRDTWYLTKLTLPQQAKTAYETAQLVEEFIRANIPLFEPWEAAVEMVLDEMLAVLIEIGEMGSVKEWGPDFARATLEWDFANPLQDAVERNKVNQAEQILGIAAGIEKLKPGTGGRNIDLDKMERDVTAATGAPADWQLDPKVVAAQQAAQQQSGDVVQGLQQAQQAADVVNTGAEAAAKLRDLTGAAADGSAAYGPT